MKQMFKTRTGLFFWPNDIKFCGDFTCGEEGELHYLYTEAERAATQAALEAAEKALDYDVNSNHGSITFSGSHQVEIRAQKIAALKLIRALKEADDD